jgi:hypothetical protein
LERLHRADTRLRLSSFANRVIGGVWCGTLG